MNKNTLIRYNIYCYTGHSPKFKGDRRYSYRCLGNNYFKTLEKTIQEFNIVGLKSIVESHFHEYPSVDLYKHENSNDEFAIMDAGDAIRVKINKSEKEISVKLLDTGLNHFCAIKKLEINKTDNKVELKVDDKIEDTKILQAEEEEEYINDALNECIMDDLVSFVQDRKKDGEFLWKVPLVLR